MDQQDMHENEEKPPAGPQQILDQAEKTGDDHKPFPLILFDMLEDSERNGFSGVVSWHRSGRAFKVHDKEAFVKSIMPRYFNQGSYKSFLRQVNLYGFSRISKSEAKGGDAGGSYFHEFLIRGHRELAHRLHRRSKRTNQSAAAASQASFSAIGAQPSMTFDTASLPTHPAFPMELPPAWLPTGIPHLDVPSEAFGSGRRASLAQTQRQIPHMDATDPSLRGMVRPGGGVAGQFQDRILPTVLSQHTQHDIMHGSLPSSATARESAAARVFQAPVALAPSTSVAAQAQATARSSRQHADSTSSSSSNLSGDWGTSIRPQGDLDTANRLVESVDLFSSSKSGSMDSSNSSGTAKKMPASDTTKPST